MSIESVIKILEAINPSQYHKITANDIFFALNDTQQYVEIPRNEIISFL